MKSLVIIAVVAIAVVAVGSLGCASRSAHAAPRNGYMASVDSDRSTYSTWRHDAVSDTRGWVCDHNWFARTMPWHSGHCYSGSGCCW